jgi:hypothetical protein
MMRREIDFILRLADERDPITAATSFVARFCFGKVVIECDENSRAVARIQVNRQSSWGSGMWGRGDGSTLSNQSTTAGNSCHRPSKRLRIKHVQMTELLRGQMTYITAFQKDQIQAEQQIQTDIRDMQIQTLLPRQFYFMTSYRVFSNGSNGSSDGNGNLAHGPGFQGSAVAARCCRSRVKRIIFGHSSSSFLMPDFQPPVGPARFIFSKRTLVSLLISFFLHTSFSHLLRSLEREFAHHVFL